MACGEATWRLPGPNLGGSNLTKQMVTLVCPQNLNSDQCRQIFVPAVLEIKYKMSGFRALSPQSFLPLLQGCVLILLSLHEQTLESECDKLGIDLRFFPTEEDLFTYSGNIPWLPCARLSAKQGRQGPFPFGRSSGAKPFTGLTNPKLSHFLSLHVLLLCYFQCSVICYLLIDYGTP